MRPKQFKRTVTASILLPEDLHALAVTMARKMNLDFSEFVRHAVRREMINTSLSQATQAQKNTIQDIAT